MSEPRITIKLTIKELVAFRIVLLGGHLCAPPEQRAIVKKVFADLARRLTKRGLDPKSVATLTDLDIWRNPEKK